MYLSDRAQAVLNFKLDLRGWRDIVRQLSAQHGCGDAKAHYHEVHLYCRGGLAERERLHTLARRYGLWADRFRFTHERQNGALVQIATQAAREELMIGTHWFMPVELADVLATELLGVADQLGITVDRIRVEKPMGRSPAHISQGNRRGWWEAHLAVEYNDELFERLDGRDIRDVSQKIDFISGECSRQGFINIEAREQLSKQFATTCTRVSQNLQLQYAGDIASSLEQVLIDLVLPVLADEARPIIQ